MSNQLETTLDKPIYATTLDEKAKPESIASTWVTSLACLVCVGIFLGLLVRNDVGSWDTLTQFGYLPANSIWRGHYWALITSAFVHIDLWHVAFNVFWLWTLGSRLERAIGSFPFLTFVLSSAYVSSTYQMAVSDTTGIGASGVVYAIFGFMWLTRDRFGLFKEALDPRTILIFVAWLFACLAATFFKIFDVGNAAHFSGLLFGCCVAAVFVLRFQRAVSVSILGIMIALSFAFLFWCPWSVTWLGIKAYDAHAAGRYEVAIDKYTRIIRLSPQNGWAFLNRSYAYQALGEEEKAGVDLEMARKIDPKLAVDQ